MANRGPSVRCAGGPPARQVGTSLTIPQLRPTLVRRHTVTKKGLPMEVDFRYTRDDWTQVGAENSRLWLLRLEPLKTHERVVYGLILVASLLAILVVPGFFAYGLWAGYAWYALAGFALLFG